MKKPPLTEEQIEDMVRDVLVEGWRHRDFEVRLVRKVEEYHDVVQNTGETK
jgi:hypothetical protein